jgi:hypothetical protein
VASATLRCGETKYMVEWSGKTPLLGNSEQHLRFTDGSEVKVAETNTHVDVCFHDVGSLLIADEASADYPPDEGCTFGSLQIEWAGKIIVALTPREATFQDGTLIKGLQINQGWTATLTGTGVLRIARIAEAMHLWSC